MISEKDMMHGMDYNRQDVSGWLMSEKLDGCRAYWDGCQMWSRGGHIISLPTSIAMALPTYALDGEIYAGPGNFEAARQAVQYGRWTPECRFHAFDAPTSAGNYRQRYEFLRANLPTANSPVIFVPHVPISQIAEARLFLLMVQKQGGEGVMLRDPANLYQPGRSNQLLKLKFWPEGL
jgi:DNA ligase-1